MKRKSWHTLVWSVGALVLVISACGRLPNDAENVPDPAQSAPESGEGDASLATIAEWRGVQCRIDGIGVSSAVRFGESGVTAHPPAVSKITVSGTLSVTKPDTFFRTAQTVRLVELLDGAGRVVPGRVDLGARSSRSGVFMAAGARMFKLEVQDIPVAPRSIGSLVMEWDVQIANRAVRLDVPLEAREEAVELGDGVFVRIIGFDERSPGSLVVNYEYRIEGHTDATLPVIGKVEIVDSSGVRKQINAGNNEVATTTSRTGSNTAQFMGSLEDTGKGLLSFTLLTDIESQTLRFGVRDLVLAD